MVIDGQHAKNFGLYGERVGCATHLKSGTRIFIRVHLDRNPSFLEVSDRPVWRARRVLSVTRHPGLLQGSEPWQSN